MRTLYFQIVSRWTQPTQTRTRHGGGVVKTDGNGVRCDVALFLSELGDSKIRKGDCSDGFLQEGTPR